MSSSSSTSQWIYDVFLSFRGEDTRRTFVAYLHDALSKAAINTYIDDRLQKGTELGPELMRAIQGSRMSIVVFSKNYNTSRWCLKELEQIMNCCRKYGQVVLPVFYDIDPSAVRYQTGGYGKALQETAKRRPSGGEMMGDRLSIWTRDLTEAANISGWDTKTYKTDVEVISQIVEDVLRKLKSKLLSITEFPVGLDTRVQQVIQFIKNQSSKVCLIGFWGMGGSGKTTTARAIYNQIHLQRKFVNLSFIENIKEVCNRGEGEIIHLQQQLLSDILKTKETVYNPASGIITIEDRFKGKKALIVLDDVSTLDQVKALCGNRKFFGWGSVLIVTSRDVRIFQLLEVDCVYSIKEMDEKMSLELFSWHAFRKPSLDADFSEFTRNIVDRCGGLPLALEVIGSSLRYRTKQHWKSTLSQLSNMDSKVQKKLKISYDGLDEAMMDIFLDICFFFIGKDRAYVSEILDGCGLDADTGITILIERSLLKVEKNNKLAMHDLLRDMGRAIVREGLKNLPGKRSRLWFHKDVHDIMDQNSGRETVEGLVLKSQSKNNVSFKADSFMKMKNLRLLQLDRVDLTGDYVHLSQKLRWLHWQRFTGDCIPDNFYRENLVVFELKRSNIKQVWSETKLMKKLKILNLSHSNYLTSTPDFSNLPNLEKLVMKDCPRLSEVHQSIGDLKNILLINLKNCTSLSNLPEKVYQLKSLKTLILSGCPNIDKLENDIVQIEDGTGVKEILYSILGLKGITYISRCGLSFEVFPSVSWSRMSPTLNSPHCISPFGNQYKVNFTELEISENSNLSLRSLLIGIGSYHIVIDTLSKSISQGLTSRDSCHFSLPGDNCPSWLAYTGDGPSAQFQVPKNIMKGIILCVAYSSTRENMGTECLTSVLIVNYTKFTVHMYKRDTLKSFNYEDWEGLTLNLEHGDNVQVFVVFGRELVVKKTSVYLIHGQSVNREVDQSIIREVEPSILVEAEPSSEVDMQLSPIMEMEPSPQVGMQPSPEMDMQPSSIMEMEPSEEMCWKRRRLL